MKIKKFVIFSIAIVIIYAIAEFIAGCWGINHDTLTTCFFSCFGGELLFTCVLKIFDKKKNDNNIRDAFNNNGMGDDVR